MVLLFAQLVEMNEIGLTQFEVSITLYVIQFYKVSTKEFTVSTINVSHISFVDHWKQKLGGIKQLNFFIYYKIIVEISSGGHQWGIVVLAWNVIWHIHWTFSLE
jgi:hypothetical protein